MAVTLPIGFDFCADDATVSHSAPNVAIEAGFIFGTSSNDYGYVSSTGITAVDRSASPSNNSLKGIHYLNPGDSQDFRVVLPSTGMTLDFRFAFGDADNAQTDPCYVRIYDYNGGSPTLIDTLSSTNDTSASQWIDATGVVRTSSSDWTSNNATWTVGPLTTADLLVRFGNTGGSTYCVYSHMAIDESGGGGPTAPAITSITPSSAYANPDVETVLLDVGITGTDMGGTTPVVNIPVGWQYATNGTWTTSTSATFDLYVPADQTPGEYNITFETDDGESNALTFTVLSPTGGKRGMDMRGGFVN